jgi:4-hydroxy-tetrahydrodipicolinate synthase
MRGIWAAALNPFNEDLSLDETGLRKNIRHWIDDLDIQNTHRIAVQTTS